MKYITHDWGWSGSDLDAPLSCQAPRTIRLEKDAASYSDVELDQRLAVVALTPQHTYQFWTEHPERLLEYFTAHNGARCRVEIDCAASMMGGQLDRHTPWPLPNLWLGVLIRNQAEVDERIPLLRQIPAAVRFLSYEPSLEGIDLSPQIDSSGNVFAPLGEERSIDCGGCSASPVRGQPYCPGHEAGGVDWVIIEPDDEPYDLAVVRDLVKQCKVAEVPCCLVRMGRPRIRVSEASNADFSLIAALARGGGSDPDEWPADLRVREYPWGEG